MIRLPESSVVLDPLLGIAHRRDLLEHRLHVRRRAAVERPGERADRRRERRTAVGPRRGDDARGERRGVQPVLGRADPVGVDRLDGLRVGLAAPLEQELLRRRLPLRDDVRRDLVGVPVGDPRRARDDPHHLRGDPAEVLARLLVRDLVQLAELPHAGEAGRLGLEVGRRVPGQPRRLVRLGLGHRRAEVVVDEEPPDVLVRVVADELDDVDAAVAKLTPPSRSGSAISVSTATMPSRPGLNSFILRRNLPDGRSQESG